VLIDRDVLKIGNLHSSSVPPIRNGGITCLDAVTIGSLAGASVVDLRLSGLVNPTLRV